MKIRCNEIVTPAGVIDGLVIVEDGKITQLVPAAELKEDAWDEDWRGYKLLPGLDVYKRQDNHSADNADK